jgi:hypothetical protein
VSLQAFLEQPKTWLALLLEKRHLELYINSSIQNEVKKYF